MMDNIRKTPSVQGSAKPLSRSLLGLLILASAVSGCFRSSTPEEPETRVEEQPEAEATPDPTPPPPPPPNTPPSASITADRTAGSAPLPVTFNASGSTDSDGAITSYAWNFGDGGTATGPAPQHTFEAVGNFTVTLTVTDDDGDTDQATTTIIVNTPPTPPVIMPVEVFSSSASSSETMVEFDVAAPAGIDTLYIKCHRCAYRDASTNPERGAKASVKLNNGAWVDLDNTTVTAYPHEAEYGGLNGALHTVRFTVPMTGAVEGKNSLTFRFNGTDSYTNGYRVLEFNLRNGDTDFLSETSFIEDNPDTWTPILFDAASIAEGEALWRANDTLRESPLDATTLRASCSDCHAQDGRDLKYFNYSDASIITRSRFHGFSQNEGEKIAAYIRSLDAPAPSQGRPWNPPYQPGPELDSRPAIEWSAGAGLEWVLEKDEDTLAYLFPNGVTESEKARIFDVNATLNMREIPLSIQLPDWNAWLPEIHPADNWGDNFETAGIGGRPLATRYAELRELIETNSLESLLADGRLKTQMDRFAGNTSHLGGANTRVINETGRESRQADGEGVTRSMVHWSAVKQWEINQELELDGLARDPGLYGPEYGEVRSWVSRWRNVFELAPHRLAPNNSHFDHQSVLVGKYFSTAWYHSQLIINAGAREGFNLGPVDWNYQPNHIVGLSRTGGGPKHPIRYIVSHAKMYQYMTNGVLPGSRGATMGFRQANLQRYLPDDDLYSEMAPALRAELLGGLLEMAVASFSSYDIDLWPRADAGNNSLGPVDSLPIFFERNRFGRECHQDSYLDCYYNSIPYFEASGVAPETIQRVIDWGETAWPSADWDALRSAGF